jgi:hypothetical protein
MSRRVAVHFLFLICVGPVLALGVAAQQPPTTSCDAVIKEYIRQTPSLDVEHRMVLERSAQPRPDESYMKVLRNMGWRQAGADLDILWDHGIKDVQVTNIRFSTSYDMLRVSDPRVSDIMPEQASLIGRFFRFALAEQAKKDFLQPTKKILEGYKEEPMILAVFDYAVFDTACIPSRGAYGPGVESIWPIQDVLTMPRHPIPNRSLLPKPPNDSQ